MDIKLIAYEIKLMDEFFNGLRNDVGKLTGKSVTTEKFIPIDRINRDKMTAFLKTIFDDESKADDLIISLPLDQIELLRFLLANCCLLVEKLHHRGSASVWLPKDLWMTFLIPLDSLFQQNIHALENKIRSGEEVLFRLLDPGLN